MGTVDIKAVYTLIYERTMQYPLISFLLKRLTLYPVTYDGDVEL